MGKVVCGGSDEWVSQFVGVAVSGSSVGGAVVFGAAVCGGRSVFGLRG